MTKTVLELAKIVMQNAPCLVMNAKSDFALLLDALLQLALERGFYE